MTRFMDDCRAGRLCIGTSLSDASTLTVETLAKAGFSFVFPDMMFGELDWGDIRQICTAARAAGITSVLRLQNYPWTGPDSVPNGSLVADAARAMALGADGVRVSVSSAADVRRLAAISRDWHRKPAPTTLEELQAQERQVREQLLLIPIIESIPALDALEEILAIPEVNACLMSGTDLPRQLGIPFQYEHPDVWRYIDRAVNLGEKYGVAVGFNTGYIYTGVEETVARINRLRDHGIKWVLVQTLNHIIYSYTKALVSGARERPEGAPS